MTADLRASILDDLRDVRDPEIPALDVVEMGIVRDVETGPDGVVVVITPTYSGCPAMRAIEDDIVAVLGRKGRRASVRVALSPPWTTEWLGPEARRKLEEWGIAAPPRRNACAGSLPSSARCPRCGAESDDLVTAFGSTPCKALWRCRECREPFELMKAV